MGIRCADHVTPLYPQKLALTSPTGGGRFVGIVRLRTKATELSLLFIMIYIHVIIIHNTFTVLNEIKPFAIQIILVNSNILVQFNFPENQ